MRTGHLGLAIACTLAASVAHAGQAVTRQSMNDTEVADWWVYDDLNLGFAEARRTGKPLLIVFR